tara:strand:+ start:8289 stop:9650 length:1362 start_codon:yes stop_codon:yes gene_type:complete
MTLVTNVNDPNRARYGLIETFTTTELDQTKILVPNGDNGVVFVEANSIIPIKENQILVTQSNVSTTLGGIIDSTKEYFLDGIIDLGTNQITVPTTGITIRGYSFGISGLISSEDNYTMFISESIAIGSGNVLGFDYLVSVTGTNSKVYELYDATGFNAFEFQRINYNDCTSLGDIYDYRQGLETGTGRFGGSPSLTLHGLWVGGYRVTTSIVRSMSDTTTEPLFKAGTAFVMNSRFLTDMNVDLGALQPLLDFAPSNFPNPSTLQLKGCIVSRDGVINSTDSNITPNMSNTDICSDWDNNQGLRNTFVGGKAHVTTQSETIISSASTFYDINGTFITNNLQHFDSPAQGQLRHLGKDPVEFNVLADFNVESTANNVIAIRITKYDSSLATFLDFIPQLRQVNSFVGGRDVAFFTISGSLTLEQNDYIKFQVANETGTANVTLEDNSFYTVQER